MGHRSLPWSALLLLLPLSSPPFAAPASARPPGDDGTPGERLLSFEKRYVEERKSWLGFKQQAESDEERAALVDAFPRDEFVQELTAIVAAAPGTDVAARAWLDVFRIGCLLDDHELYARGLERLLSDHGTSRELAGLTLELVYGAPSWSVRSAQDALRKILAVNPDPGVQVGALAQLSLLVGLDDSLGQAGREEARALLTRIEKEFDNKDLLGMTGKQFTTGAWNEIDRLRVGQVAPDFELPDQDGVRFHLSDYRGRVVLLDFWGFV